MDVVGLVGAVVGIADVIVKSVDCLKQFRDSYAEADFRVGALISHLLTIKAALSNVGEMINDAGSGLTQPGPFSRQFFEDLSVSLNGCEAMVCALDSQLASLQRNDHNGLSASSKFHLALQDSTIDGYLSMLNNQTNALQLLLTSLHCRSSVARSDMLHLESTRKIFKQVKDDTSSMLWLYDEESLLSARTTRTQQDMSTISTEFSFDSDLITSKVYRTAMRSHMIFAIGHTSGDSIYQPRPPLSAFRMTRSFSVRSDRLSISETLKTDFSDESIRDSASVSSRLTWLSQRRPLSIKVKGKPDTGDAQSVASKIGSMYTGDASLRRFWNRRNQAKTPSSPVLQGVAPAYAPKNATNVVVLGLARTGKSTLIKSLVYTFGGMDIRHRQSYNEDIQREATEAILVIQEDSGVRAGLGHHYCKHLHGSMGPDLGDVYALLWTEPVFRSKVIERQRSREKHIKPLPESAEHFLSSTQRLARPRYIPSASDVLWTYQPSQGISVTNIKARGRGYNFFDTQSSFDGLGYGHKFLRVLHRADVLVCTFDASCLGDTDHFHTSDKVMQSQMESLKGIVGDSRLLATKIIVLFTKVDRLVPDVMAQLLGTAQFIDFTGPKTVDTVLNHMARKIATLLGHTSKTITFWRASIAHSATEMADVALNALEQMDDSIEDTLDEEEEDEYKEKVFDYDDVMHAHGFI